MRFLDLFHDLPYIFRTSTGPIHVFVEASDILNRPKLIRALRNAGALISHSPADAHIILVDSSTDAGLRFVTDWGSDPGKVVLDAQWAWKSIKRGRLYLEDEGWGGFQARGESSNQESANRAGLTEHPLPPLEQLLPMDISPDHRHSPSGPSAREQKGLFTNKAGEPLHFVVQVDIRNRKTIVDGIKKNGGKIISEISQADYVILTQSSRSFKDLLKQTENAERPAVQAQFVYDCIEKQTLLDEREYLFQDTLPKKKRGRPSGQTPVKSQKMETPTKEKAKELEGGTPQTKKMGTAEKPQKTKEVKVKSKPKEEPDSLSFQGLWEPSPPPPVRVVEYVDGRNLYTKEDRDYFVHYLSILAKRNPEMTYASIGEKMYSKMPHHTVKSWTAFAQKQKDQIDTAKKKAHIARRKAAESRRQQSSSQPSISSVPSAGSSEGPSLKQAVSPVDEFKTMTEFFASGGADQISDHEVWVTLAEVYPSRTAQGWHDFWREHSEEIDTEVKPKTGTGRVKALQTVTFLKHIMIIIL
ncbi:hypothetical protein A0H81_01035 [Grifola frondosa]|uniref:DNA-binding protein RAP1 n=1 Tax=Grifola frondosa TaxID=5627 RepID=A0A1C7MR76_GRIFR|nr:hypothetical protein A0H81_01035 [Grifola frondosa]